MTEQVNAELGARNAEKRSEGGRQRSEVCIDAGLRNCIAGSGICLSIAAWKSAAWKPS